MSILKKRSVALLLAVLIVLGSSAATVSAKINKKSDEVSSLFYSGVKYEGFKHKSISSQLSQITAAADGLVTIASNYGLDTDSVTSANRGMKSALSEGGNSFGAFYSLYDELLIELNKLIYGMQAAELSERDFSGLEQYSAVLKGAGSVIEQAGYNESVREYIDDMSGFPSRIFINLLNIDLPETFA